MRRQTRWTTWVWLAAAVLSPCLAFAQTLTITSGVESYASLSGTTVTLSGHCELWLTTSGDPLPGSLVDLTSEDAWVILPNLPPSTVASSYLSRIRINGAGAVADGNVRVVQYAMGAVVIPQASDFRPLEAFSGTHFAGASQTFAPYTLYTGSMLGELDGRIRSLRLKRGYMATVATEVNGTGPSQCVVAQDGDLEFSVLPPELDGAIRFIRVFPWRWSSKKGSCDVSPTALNATWHYNWNISLNSTRDWEYVAIRQQPYWPGLNQNWQTRGVNHLSGYNEPNNPVEDAYKNLNPPGSVSDAVARWPELLGTGLRVGAPAVTDGGYGWIADFINQAEVAGHRIDYVPVHYYRSYWNNDDPAGAANQLYNFLKGIHDVSKRPIWLTEFNNGANWTDNAYDPNVTQNRNVIEAMINMMDDTPWVERYAIYSHVEWFRQTHYDDGSITPMGAMYRDHESPMAYRQEIPGTGGPGIAQLSFESTARDVSGHGNNGFAFGIPDYTTGPDSKAIVLDGARNFLQLPREFVDNNHGFTFAAWVYWDGGADWQRIFDFGSGTSAYMFLTPSASSSQLRFSISTSGGSGEQRLEGGAFPMGQWTHVAVVISGSRGWLYVNGSAVAVSNSMSLDPSDVRPIYNYLGKSQFAADPLFAGKLDNVLISDDPKSPSEIVALMGDHAPTFGPEPLILAEGMENDAYTGTVAGAASDPDSGDSLTYRKIAGPDWLTVDAAGDLSGTPPAGAGGANTFVIGVTDAIGLGDIATLEMVIAPTPQVNLANGSFEQPYTTDYTVAPIGSSWTFRSSSGVAANGGSYTAGNDPAPEGSQVAFLQQRGLMSQQLTDFAPGREYTLQFMASQRQNVGGGQAGQTLGVYIGSTVIGSLEPPQASGAYQLYSIPFIAPADHLTLTFRATNLNGGDNTVLIDNVVIAGLPLSALPAAPTLVSAVAGDGQVDLNWTAVDGAVGYHLKRGAAEVGPYDVVAGNLVVTNHLDLSVTNGMTHYYVVSASNNLAEGPDSAPLAAHPVSLAPPGLDASGDTNGLSIRWSPDHTGWRLQMQTGSVSTNWVTLPDSSTTNWLLVPMTNDSAYYRLHSP